MWSRSSRRPGRRTSLRHPWTRPQAAIVSTIARRECEEPACKPDSVVDDHRSGTNVAVRLVRPTRRCFDRHADRRNGRAAHASCLALLRTGFTWPQRSPAAPVSSYLTLSPLPRRTEAVCSLLHLPRVAPPGNFPSVLPCGVRTFLDPDQVRAAAVRPAPHPSIMRLHPPSVNPVALCATRFALGGGDQVVLKFILRAARSSEPRSGRPRAITRTAFPIAPAVSQPNEVAP